ncbi:MAG: YdcF family protein [Amaricoccus sp.]
MRLIVRLAANLLLLYLLTAAAVVASAVWFAFRPPTQTAGALIVLGGAMTSDNTLGGQTRARVEAAVALFNAGAAPRVLFTGGGAAEGQVPAGEQMRALAVALGMPAAVTAVETDSRSTLQNALLSRPVLGPLADGPVMLVSDGFHLARAWASFRWAGYRQIRLAAATPFGDEPLPEQLRWIGREALAWWFNPARVIAFEILERVRGPDPARIHMLD